MAQHWCTPDRADGDGQRHHPWDDGGGDLRDTSAGELGGHGQPEEEDFEGKGDGDDAPLSFAQGGADAHEEPVDEQVDGDRTEKSHRQPAGAVRSRFDSPGGAGQA